MGNVASHEFGGASSETRSDGGALKSAPGRRRSVSGISSATPLHHQKQLDEVRSPPGGDGDEIKKNSTFGAGLKRSITRRLAGKGRHHRQHHKRTVSVDTGSAVAAAAAADAMVRRPSETPSDSAIALSASGSEGRLADLAFPTVSVTFPESQSMPSLVSAASSNGGVSFLSPLEPDHHLSFVVPAKEDASPSFASLVRRKSSKIVRRAAQPLRTMVASLGTPNEEPTKFDWLHHPPLPESVTDDGRAVPKHASSSSKEKRRRATTADATLITANPSDTHVGPPSADRAHRRRAWHGFGGGHRHRASDASDIKYRAPELDAEISLPTEVQQQLHIEWDDSVGAFRGVPPEWRAVFPAWTAVDDPQMNNAAVLGPHLAPPRPVLRKPAVRDADSLCSFDTDGSSSDDMGDDAATPTPDVAAELVSPSPAGSATPVRPPRPPSMALPLALTHSSSSPRSLGPMALGALGLPRTPDQPHFPSGVARTPISPPSGRLLRPESIQSAGSFSRKSLAVSFKLPDDFHMNGAPPQQHVQQVPSLPRSPASPQQQQQQQQAKPPTIHPFLANLVARNSPRFRQRNDDNATTSTTLSDMLSAATSGPPALLGEAGEYDPTSPTFAGVVDAGNPRNMYTEPVPFAESTRGHVVCKATDMRLGLQVVVKLVCNADAAEAVLAAEARLLTRAHHPHVVALLGSYLASSSSAGGGLRDLWLVSEHMVHGPLADHLDMMRARLPDPAATDAVLAVAASVASALEYLHTRLRIVHGDVRSDNVFVGANGSVKLNLRPRATLALGAAGTIVGPPPEMPQYWMAPEVAARALDPETAPPSPSGSSLLGAPTDVWALGILVCEMVIEYPPTDDEDTEDDDSFMLTRAAGTDAPPLVASVVAASLPPQPLVSMLLLRCLDTDPDRRATTRDVAALDPRWADRAERELALKRLFESS
ncbi:hypothetical protein BC828DRAFT_117846 [Blastocladiella britannica]|nr:hypothetical protein BC828DRAFT_117846 [Blastocladiella britannica]